MHAPLPKLRLHLRRAGFRRVGLALLAFASTTVRAPAQGRADYFDVESPQVSPIALATVGTRKVLLVCNTPDNSIEIWDTDETITPASGRFIQRQRVGLEPVSVQAQGDRFWTANFLGDSVTAGKLELVNGQVRARLTATAEVGDEPMDIAFYDDAGTRTIFVTLHTSNAIAWLDADTLIARDAANPRSNLVQPSGSPPHGLNEPRALRVFGNRIYALAFKGGVTHASSTHDLDVLSSALPAVGTPPSFGVSIATMGSTNFNMRFSSGGELWAVGGEARNFDNDTGPAVAAEPSGFVQSTLYRVFNPGTATPGVFRRDINRNCNTVVDGSTADLLPLAMPTDLALYETDGVVRKAFVAAFSSDRIGVFAAPPVPIACTQSPPVPPNVRHLNWIRRTIDYPATTAGGNPRWGPRGMTIGANQAGTIRLYVVNRLDNSLSIFDPVGETHVESVPLSHDPTPQYIREGREFLYSADIDQKGFNSCASCHTDARTDALSWKLGNPSHAGMPDTLPLLADVFRLAGTGVFNTGGTIGDPYFFVTMLFPPLGPPTANPPRFDPDTPEDKREMVTQSLQGLSNFEVAFDPAAQPDQADLVRKLFHNGPFHWRGDKRTLRDFNEAFVALLGGVDLDGVAPPNGLTEAQMDEFETFLHGVNYPPNPKEPKNRVFSASDSGTGFVGGQDGLVDFHTDDTLRGRSCVMCHSLPEGSNNRLTVFVTDGPFAGYVTQTNRQPIESAAMRGLFQKQPLLEPDGNFPDNSGTTPVLGHFGMNHTGVLVPSTSVNPHTSLNLFVDVFFLGNVNGTPAKAMKQFAHEFDWGVAPTIGQLVFAPQTILGGNITALVTKVHEMEDQVELANASLVAWGEFPNQAQSVRGWRYYPVGGGTYVEEPGFAQYSLGDLRNLLVAPEDSITFLTVPLGSERRVAAPTGIAGTYLQWTPANVALETMVPDTAYSVVPSLRDNWVPDDAPPNILAGAAPFTFLEPDGMDEVFTQAIRLFQYGLLDGQNAASYGVSQLRHEAPRRLRVRGESIVTGAKLLLSVPYPTLPYNGLPPSDPTAQPTFPTVTLELPIYPTDDLVWGQTVWETAVEVEPIWAYALMLGGPRAPHPANTSLSTVQNTIDTVICQQLDDLAGLPPFCNQFGLPTTIAISEPVGPGNHVPPIALPYDPDHWNWFKVVVRNPGPGGPSDPSGPTSTPVWQQLKM